MGEESSEIGFLSSETYSKWKIVNALVDEIISNYVSILFFAGGDEGPVLILKYPNGAQYKIDVVASLRNNPLILRTPPFDKLILEAIRRYTVNLTHPIHSEAQRCEKYLREIFEALMAAVKARQKEERKLYEASWLSPAATSFFEYVSLLPQLPKLQTSRSKSAKRRIIEELERILWESCSDKVDLVSELLGWLSDAYLNDGTIKLPHKLSPESIRNHLYSWMLCCDDKEGDEVPDPGAIRKRFYDAKQYLKQMGYQPEQLSRWHEIEEKMYSCDAHIVDKKGGEALDVKSFVLNGQRSKLTTLGIGIVSPSDSIEESALVYVRILPSQQE